VNVENKNVHFYGSKKRVTACCLQIAILLGLTGLFAACADPIVDARCKKGFSACAGHCVDLQSDPGNCGQCGVVCESAICENGECASNSQLDATLVDAGLPDVGLVGPVIGTADGARSDGSADGASSDGESGRWDGSFDGGFQDTGGGDGGAFEDTGVLTCGLGELRCGGGCVRPDIDIANCGECDMQCDPNQLCSAGICSFECAAPLVDCGGICVDLDSDPANCGYCDHVCASGICELSECADTPAGHLVIIGHDFTSSNSAMQRVAGNAVFLARGAPVSVLVYEEGSDFASIAGIDQAIDYVASTDGRSWQREAASATLLPFRLATANVLVIYTQQQATNDQLQTLGQEWALAINEFLRGGGVIVLFDGAGNNDGTYQLLGPAGVFYASSMEQASDMRLTLAAPGDQVALGVPKQYVARGGVVRFENIGTPAEVVVKDSSDLPVIVHRVIAP
jgi:hypothetical protein